MRIFARSREVPWQKGFVRVGGGLPPRYRGLLRSRDPAEEATRDLVRTREDAVAMQRQARHGLAALLLRNDLRYAGKTAWTQAHRRCVKGTGAPR